MPLSQKLALGVLMRRVVVLDEPERSSARACLTTAWD
jgi:hypothetical protein